jgi:dihydrofolate reductase
MIDIETAIYIHNKIIDKTGGGKGIRDQGALESALFRPYATFDGTDLYPTTIEKAAALFESLIINHPFIDGNKRMAYVLMKLTLAVDKTFVITSENEKYEMAIKASQGDLRFDEIKLWLQSKTNKMILSSVVAISENHVIGKDNQLLWYLPNDLKHFKAITSGHTVIMGRKTFESVGKPLPRRRNIIITRKDIAIEGCEVVNSIEAALELCKDEEEVFIVGGAEIYRQSMKLTDRIYLTIVHKEFEGDSFFPEINKEQWKEVSREDFEPDEKNSISYSFITLERR